MKRKFLFTALLLCFSSVAANAQTKQPRTVRDFFMLMPVEYFSIDCCGGTPDTRNNNRDAKEKYLKQYLTVEDTVNGYMSGAGDAAQEGFDMALFTRSDRTYLIGFYTEGEGGVEDTPWCVFLEYVGPGHWLDISRNVIPSYDPKKFIYSLPRKGTTIEVFRKDENGEGIYRGRKLHDLVWKNGKFTVRR